MSSSSNGSPRLLEYRDIESFAYQDTSLVPDMTPRPEPATRSERSGNNGAGALQISQAELSRLISEAREEGRMEASKHLLAKAEEDLATERQRIAEALVQFQRERADYYSKIEAEVVHLALAIASKILHREAQVDRMVVAGLVKVTLEKLQQSASVTVRVPPGEGANWQKYFHEVSNLSVLEDSTLKPNDCVLETGVGSAHLGFDAQLKEIEQGFFDLLAQRPTPK